MKIRGQKMADYEKYYEKSVEALTKYIGETKVIPTEKIWNKMAINQNYLTSQSLGYLSGIKFPELCKKIYKQTQKRKGNKKNEYLA